MTDSEVHKAEVLEEPWEPTDRERLAVAQALYKAVAGQVSTKGDGLRRRCDDELLAMYEGTGVKSLDLKIDGQKVGTYTVKVAKAKKTTEFETVNESALMDWASANGCLKTVIDYDRVRGYFEATGEVPDGCTIKTVTTPEHVSGTALKVEPAKVAEALGGYLPQAVAGLLEGDVA